MKVAIVHDYIKEYGGAERVLEALCELYPRADIFTTVYLPQFLGPHKKRFEKRTIHTSFLQHIPFKQKLISPFRLLSPLAFRSFDFTKYDVIITSATGAYFPNTLDKKKAKLICYCHTPPRYLYGYATAREWKKHTLLRIIGETMNHILRMVDFSSSQNVDLFIANSEEVRARIAKFYRKDAKVVYPPVDIAKETIKSKEKNSFYLAGGRLARPKHIDLIVKACTELKVPLTVFGKSFAGYGDELKEMAGKNVTFVGEVSDDEKKSLMRDAKAFLFSSEDEDFGIVPVEAMSYGLPVIAYKSGGVKETIIDSKTGIFFDALTVESLKKAIQKSERTQFDSGFIKNHTKKFSKERFLQEIQRIVM